MNTEQWYNFYEVCRSNDLEALQRMKLVHAVDYNQQNYYHYIACGRTRRAACDIIYHLGNKNFHVPSKNAYPIQIACACDNLEVLKWFVAQDEKTVQVGAGRVIMHHPETYTMNPNGPNACTGHRFIMKHYHCGSGDNLLHLCVRNRSMRCLAFLVVNNLLDPQLENSQGQNAVDLAKQKGIYFFEQLKLEREERQLAQRKKAKQEREQRLRAQTVERERMKAQTDMIRDVIREEVQQYFLEERKRARTEQLRYEMEFKEFKQKQQAFVTELAELKQIIQSHEDICTHDMREVSYNNIFTFVSLCCVSLFVWRALK